MENNSVWVFDTEYNDWKKVELIEKYENSVDVKINDEIYNYSEYAICNNIDDIEKKNNLVDIPNLNEPEILNAIDKRYNTDIIYTYTGRILIAVNPFKNLSLFTDDMIDLYKNKKNNRQPHIYEIGDKAYNSLMKYGKNQTILVSGESGAGKTYSVRSILKYLTSLSKNDSDIEKRIVESNPILEAFGNAKTLRNDNSSRFGKFIKVQIKNYKILGCKIDTYLLEKIRVTNQSDLERNFHIFYQLILGCDREKYYLSGPENYKYLNNKYISCRDVDDSNEYDKTISAFRVMGFTEENIDKILKIISAILNLGNVEFNEDGKIIENDYFENVLKLLNLSRDELTECLCIRKLKTVGETIDINNSKEECVKSLNSLSMKLYSGVFDNIVKIINTNLKCECDSFIGILDIFGFESFEKNRFEQFCINYTNEKLQDQFNEYMFKEEQKEYELEGIDWSNISFPDNKDCLNLIENKKGIIKMLDEESKLPRGNDKSFTNKLLKMYDENVYIEKNKRFGSSRFIIKHYAGDVEYDTVGFCEKNKDIISDSIKMIVNKVLLFEDKSEITSSINMKTVALQFKGQLLDLMKVIYATSPQYIRCIKPNDKNIPDCFNRIRVNQQIKYSGILAAVKVSRAGYPIRFKKDFFKKRYGIIKNFETLDILLTNLDEKHYAVGKNKIFLKNHAYDNLESERNNSILEKVILIQNKYRGYICRKNFKIVLKCVIKIQSLIRVLLSKIELKKRRELKASVVIQKYYRGCNRYKKYKNILKAVRLIKKCYKKYKFEMYIKKITKIQRCVRKWIKYNFDKKLRLEKEQWHKMSLKWKELEDRTQISGVLDSIIRQIIYNSNAEDFDKKKKKLDEIERERVLNIKKERELLDIERKKIIEMQEKLKKDNDMFKESIKNNVSEKMSLMSDMERLMKENMIIKRQLSTLHNRTSNSNCIIT